MTKKEDKKLKKFIAVLQKFISKKAVVKIERTVTEGEANIGGILIKQSKDFLQLMEANDFELDGQIIIRMDQFDSIINSDFEQSYAKILRKEGELKRKLPQSTKVDLKDWHSIFTSLMKKDIHVIIECETLKDPTFTIGPIEKISSKCVYIRYYDANGKLDKKLTKIRFKNITLLKFGDRYSTTFRKYLTD